ncbi:basic salivary proline-rich protein 1-like [Hippopotamus amphibius kiboko]|uniref:basic salivary proline-rich protein 1-like n=1 Tax=Hippopotamus amphibius kiboko TaxID=575201 RepID=UPI002597E892|nr:basic salivary proline-rich protein 1-like [Hippopotamus amphibius kiboko]
MSGFKTTGRGDCRGVPSTCAWGPPAAPLGRSGGPSILGLPPEPPPPRRRGDISPGPVTLRPGSWRHGGPRARGGAGTQGTSGPTATNSKATQPARGAGPGQPRPSASLPPRPNGPGAAGHSPPDPTRSWQGTTGCPVELPWPEPAAGQETTKEQNEAACPSESEEASSSPPRLPGARPLQWSPRPAALASTWEHGMSQPLPSAMPGPTQDRGRVVLPPAPPDSAAGDPKETQKTAVGASRPPPRGNASRVPTGPPIEGKRQIQSGEGCQKGLACSTVAGWGLQEGPQKEQREGPAGTPPRVPRSAVAPRVHEGHGQLTLSPQRRAAPWGRVQGPPTPDAHTPGTAREPQGHQPSTHASTRPTRDRSRHRPCEQAESRHGRLASWTGQSPTPTLPEPAGAGEEVVPDPSVRAPGPSVRNAR